MSRQESLLCWNTKQFLEKQKKEKTAISISIQDTVVTAKVDNAKVSPLKCIMLCKCILPTVEDHVILFQ
jgi:hypothetical protein